MITKFNGISPRVDVGVFIAENATVIGNVTIGAYSSIWPNAVIRGDEGEIIIGEYSNIQDNATVHCDEGGRTIIGDYVTVGHNAIVHGCEVSDNVIVGMGAIILNGAKIGKNCIVGAGAVVLENTIIPDNSLVVGVPGKVKGNLSDEKIEFITRNAQIYQELSSRYLEGNPT